MRNEHFDPLTLAMWHKQKTQESHLLYHTKLIEQIAVTRD